MPRFRPASRPLSLLAAGLLAAAMAAGAACVARDAAPRPAASPAPAAVPRDTRTLFERAGAMGAAWGRGATRGGGQVWERRWLGAMAGNISRPLRDSQRLVRVTWGQLLAGAEDREGRVLLDYVQDEWSQVRCLDLRGESMADWVPPSMLAQERSGTSGDIAAAKYVTLRRLGWPASRVWVAGLGDASGRTLFFVCAEDGRGQVWVLDPAQGCPAAYALEELRTRHAGRVPVCALGEGETVVFSGGAVPVQASAGDPLAGPPLPAGGFSAPLVPMGDTGVMSLTRAERAAGRGVVESGAVPGMIDTGVRSARPAAPVLDLKPGMPVR